MQSNSRAAHIQRMFPVLRLLAALGITAGALAFWQVPAQSQDSLKPIPAPEVDEPAGAAGTEVAVFSGGCFWGVQGVFQHVKGVKQAISGYAGGSKATADYETVSTGTTGHAESVQVAFDPRQVTYGQLLQIFFSVAHDPTQLNQQYPDHGTQYRSAVFATSPEQKEIADRYIAQLNKAAVFAHPIVTQTDALKGFYPAEDHHQNYLTLNPTYPYIATYDIPKIRNLKRLFPQQYRDDPVLVAASAK